MRNLEKLELSKNCGDVDGTRVHKMNDLRKADWPNCFLCLGNHRITRSQQEGRISSPNPTLLESIPLV